MSDAVLVRPRRHGLTLGPTVSSSEAVGRRVRQLTVAGVVALAVLNAADTVTTHLVLAHASAGAVEANPLAKVLLANGSLLAVKMTVIAILGVAVLRDRPKLGLLAGSWLTAGLYLAAVLSNVLILRML